MTMRSYVFLDGLRGLAALLVYVYHFNVTWYYSNILYGFGQDHDHYSFPLLPFIRTFYTGGVASVAIFFVLSGFVLTISPLHKIQSSTEKESMYRSIMSSFIRRPVRLYLPCLLVLWTQIIKQHISASPTPEKRDLVSVLGATAIEVLDATWSFIKFANPLRPHSFTQPFAYGIQYWTIPIELKGSILVYILLAFSVGQPSPGRDLLRLVLTGLLFHQIGQWTMSLFVFGMCLAMCEVHGWDLTDLPLLWNLSPTNRKRFNYLIFFVGWWLSCQVDRTIAWSRATPGWGWLTLATPAPYKELDFVRYWVGYGAVLVVYSILRIDLLQAFFSRPPLVWLGKISFVLYLTHTHVMTMVAEICKRVVGEKSATLGALGSHWYDSLLYLPDIGPMGLNIRWLGALLLTTPFCLVFAHLTVGLYDRSGVRAAKWLAKRCGYER